MSYAIATYLSKQHAKALDIIGRFENMIKADKKMKLKKYERSELVLFKARVLEELGEYQKAIDTISKKGEVVNQLALNEQLARLYRALGDKDKAIERLE